MRAVIVIVPTGMILTASHAPTWIGPSTLEVFVLDQDVGIGLCWGEVCCKCRNDFALCGYFRRGRDIRERSNKSIAHKRRRLESNRDDDVMESGRNYVIINYW